MIIFCPDMGEKGPWESPFYTVYCIAMHLRNYEQYYYSSDHADKLSGQNCLIFPNNDRILMAPLAPRHFRRRQLTGHVMGDKLCSVRPQLHLSHIQYPTTALKWVLALFIVFCTSPGNVQKTRNKAQNHTRSAINPTSITVETTVNH